MNTYDQRPGEIKHAIDRYQSSDGRVIYLSRDPQADRLLVLLIGDVACELAIMDVSGVIRFKSHILDIQEGVIAYQGDSLLYDGVTFTRM